MGKETGAFRERLGSAILRGIVYVILIAGASTMILPFLWMLSTSVMTLGEANTGRLLPRVARLSCPHVNLAKYVEGGVTLRFALRQKVVPNRPKQDVRHLLRSRLLIERDPVLGHRAHGHVSQIAADQTGIAVTAGKDYETGADRQGEPQQSSSFDDHDERSLPPSRGHANRAGPWRKPP